VTKSPRGRFPKLDMPEPRERSESSPPCLLSSWTTSLTSHQKGNGSASLEHAETSFVEFSLPIQRVNPTNHPSRSPSDSNTVQLQRFLGIAHCVGPLALIAPDRTVPRWGIQSRFSAATETTCFELLPSFLNTPTFRDSELESLSEFNRHRRSPIRNS